MSSLLPSALSRPLRLGALDLARRIVMAGPVHQHAQRATTGGLLISEAVAVSADGLADARAPGLFATTQVNAWREVTDAVHARGGLVLAQLGHAGLALLKPPHAPAPDDLDRWINDFRNAAENAGDAGFDGVELQLTGGALAERLLACGTAQEAALWISDLLRALAAPWGPARVGLRLESAQALAPRLLADAQQLGVAYAHVVLRAGDEPRSWRRWFRGPLLVTGFATLERATAAIESGDFDAAVLDPACLPG